MKRDIKYIYSDGAEIMVPYGFIYRNYHWTWNEYDLVYYRDDVEDRIIDYENMVIRALAGEVELDRV